MNEQTHITGAPFYSTIIWKYTMLTNVEKFNGKNFKSNEITIESVIYQMRKDVGNGS